MENKYNELKRLKLKREYLGVDPGDSCHWINKAIRKLVAEIYRQETGR